MKITKNKKTNGFSYIYVAIGKIDGVMVMSKGKTASKAIANAIKSYNSKNK